MLECGSSGFGFSNTNYDNWNTNTNCSSHLCKQNLHYTPCPHGKKLLLIKIGASTERENDYLKTKA
jgi:hypothetical protein